MAAKWEKIRDVRSVVTGALEIERQVKKNIGSALEAAPDIHIANPELLAAVKGVDLAEISITSGAKLIESVGTQLPLAQDYKLGYTRFILLQRVAQEGERALIRVISANPDSDDDLLALISQVYTWGTSLRDYQQAT